MQDRINSCSPPPHPGPSETSLMTKSVMLDEGERSKMGCCTSGKVGLQKRAWCFKSPARRISFTPWGVRPAISFHGSPGSEAQQSCQETELVPYQSIQSIQRKSHMKHAEMKIFHSFIQLSELHTAIKVNPDDTPHFNPVDATVLTMSIRGGQP